MKGFLVMADSSALNRLRRKSVAGMAAAFLPVIIMLVNGGTNASAQSASTRLFSYTLDTYAGTGKEFMPLKSNTLSDELQWLAVQTASTSMYNMAQTGDFTQPDPEDWYKPNHIRSYLTELSGSQTQNTMIYGICFNYAQAAYDDITKYREHYEKLGMKETLVYCRGL